MTACSKKVLLALLLSSLGVWAAEETFSLSWVAPADCAARPDVHELVGDSAGAASVVIAASGGRWKMELTLSAPVQGYRTLEAETCEEAAEAARLLLRLGVRGMLPPQEEPTATENIAEPPLVRVVPEKSVFLSVAALGTGQLLSLPGFSARVGVLLWLELEWWALVAQLSTGFSRQFSGGPVDEATVEVHPVLEGVVSGCFSPHWGAVKVAGCIDFQAAWWLMRGVNVSSPRQGSAALLAIGPAIRALFPVGNSFDLMAGLAFRPVVLRPQANFEGYGKALEAGPFVLGFELGFGLRW